jgi:hypothetical protein
MAKSPGAAGQNKRGKIGNLEDTAAASKRLFLITARVAADL